MEQVPSHLVHEVGLRTGEIPVVREDRSRRLARELVSGFEALLRDPTSGALEPTRDANEAARRDMAAVLEPQHTLARLLIDKRVDRAIRRIRTDCDAWLALDPQQVPTLVRRGPRVLALLGCHPNGRVREAAIDAVAEAGAESPTLNLLGALRNANPVASTERGRMRSEAIAAVVALRTVDHVSPVRAKAQRLVAELLAEESARCTGGSMFTAPWVVTVVVAELPRAAVLCPALVHQAIDLLDLAYGPYSGRNYSLLAHSTHRRTQLLRHLQSVLAAGDADPFLDSVTPGARFTIERLIDWHRRALRHTEPGHVPPSSLPRPAR